jgi:hypothetical protein
MSSNAAAAVVVEPKMEDFKKAVVDYKMRVFASGGAGLDPRSIGIFILTKVIPMMDAQNDIAFFWHWARSDVGVYNQKEYDEETGRYKKQHKMVKDDGDATWFYDFKNKDGKMRRCIITTEIWYKKGADHNVSPIAYLFGQMFGNGFHIAKCRFEDV